MDKGLRSILLAAGIFYLAFILGTSFVINDQRYFTLVDDAMISMRYAQHLAQGHGLVWNIGEKPVQGFTNPGWTLLMAFFHLIPIPISKISLTIMATSAILLLANVAVVYKIAERLLPESTYAPILVGIMTAFYFPLVFWSLRGMELGLLSLLIDYALLLSITKKESILVGLVLALAVMTRLDAIPAAVLIGIYSILKPRTRNSFLPLILILIASFVILGLQRYYYGDFLPATYYQKVAGYTIFDRMKHGLLMFNEFATRDILLPLLFSIAGLYYYKQSRSMEMLLLLGIFLVQCAYSVYVGGDYAEPETNAANRFISQGMPALLVVFGVMVSRVLSDLQSARSHPDPPHAPVNPAYPIALAVLLIISGEPWFNYAVNNAPLLKSDIRRVKIGLHIAENTSPQAVIAVHAAGQIPYYSQRAAIDLLGLNDPIVAKGPPNGEFYPGHNKWNYEYSIGQYKPDLIADNFAPLAEYIRETQAYQKLDSDIYVRRDSPLINLQGLNEDYR